MGRPRKQDRVAPVQMRVHDAHYFMTEKEVAVIEYWPSGMPRSLSIVTLEHFIDIAKKVIGEREVLAPGEGG